MIRRAEYADVNAIAQVHVQSWMESYQGMLRQSILEAHNFDKCQSIWNVVIGDLQHQVWVYEYEGLIQGFIDIYKIPNQKITEIKALYLLKRIQRQGIGSALMQQAFIWSKALGCQQIQLDIFDRNPSCLFYEKLGAKRTDQEDASDYADDLKIIYYQWVI